MPAKGAKWWFVAVQKEQTGKIPSYLERGMDNTAMVLKRTRIAPTPSGFLHLGNIFSFAITCALAKRMDLSVLLRIDDLDRLRASDEYLADIFETLQFLGIEWNEGPRDLSGHQGRFSQMYRMPHYAEALDQLVDAGRIYACECTRSSILAHYGDGTYAGACREKNIPLDRPGVNWRLRTDKNLIAVHDLFTGVNRHPLPDVMNDFVVRKKDGFPAYQLTSVVDDRYFGIDAIVRGADLWDSTLAQVYLARLLGYDDFVAAKFFHHPLLKDEHLRKLSKSAGATSVHYLRREGRTPADIFALVGRMAGITVEASGFDEFAAQLLADGIFLP